MNERTKQIYVRVTPQEKKRIAVNAKECGLSVSEYIRQRSLGFAPREIPPQVYYSLCDKLDALSGHPGGEALPAILEELRAAVILPGRDK